MEVSSLLYKFKILPSIIIYMKQNDVHKVIILYLYTRGRNDYGGETTSGDETTRGEMTRGKHLGGKTTRGEMVWGPNARIPNLVKGSLFTKFHPILLKFPNEN